jgi:hypothetical protein
MKGYLAIYNRVQNILEVIGPTTKKFKIALGTSAGVVCFNETMLTDGTNISRIHTDATWTTPGVEAHFAVVWTTGTGVILLYKDGVAHGTPQAGVALLQNQSFAHAASPTLMDLAAEGNTGFNGTIRDFALFGSALTAGQVEAVANRTYLSGLPNPTFYLPCNEGRGQVYDTVSRLPQPFRTSGLSMVWGEI